MKLYKTEKMGKPNFLNAKVSSMLFLRPTIYSNKDRNPYYHLFPRIALSHHREEPFFYLINSHQRSMSGFKTEIKYARSDSRHFSCDLSFTCSVLAYQPCLSETITLLRRSSHLFYFVPRYLT